MGLRVERASSNDAQRFADIERAAEVANDTSAALFPGPFPDDDGSRATHLKECLTSSAACKWVKVIDEDLEINGEECIVAFSVWYVFETGGNQLPALSWGPGCNVDACDYYFGGLRDEWRQSCQDRPHVYLKYMNTHPEHQRRGAGKLMMAWGVEKADSHGLVSYLEASPEGRGLYEKFGFVTEKVVDFDLSKWNGPLRDSVPIMVRQPLSKNAK